MHDPSGHLHGVHDPSCMVHDPSGHLHGDLLQSCFVPQVEPSRSLSTYTHYSCPKVPGPESQQPLKDKQLWMSLLAWFRDDPSLDAELAN